MSQGFFGIEKSSHESHKNCSLKCKLYYVNPLKLKYQIYVSNTSKEPNGWIEKKKNTSKNKKQSTWDTRLNIKNFIISTKIEILKPSSKVLIQAFKPHILISFLNIFHLWMIGVFINNTKVFKKINSKKFYLSQPNTEHNNV